MYFDSCFAALRAAGRCFSFAFPAIEDRPTAVQNVGRRPGGNNCARPIDAINEAWKHDWIMADKTTVFGEIVTCCVIAGGSKASLKLFQDVMDVRSSARYARGAATSQALQ